MRIRLILALVGVISVLAIAGCPRDDSGGKAPEVSKPTSSVPPTTPPTTPPATPPNMSPTGAPPATPPGTPPTTTPPGTPPTTPPATPPATPPTTPPATPPATGKTEVVEFETTKGIIDITVHDDWAPLGAKHFIELVNAKFYDGAPWFRVMDKFVAQCGVSAKPELNAQWGEKNIMDEPLKKGNVPGTVCFGKSGAPNSRTTHIFINLADNSQGLDPQGFSCFGEVTKGMDVAQKLTKCVYSDQHGLGMPGGLEAFKKMFPDADYIKKATVKK